MRLLAFLLVIGLTVYAVIDCVRAERWERRGLPLWLWILVIVVLPVIGALTWLISRWTTPSPGPGRRPAARPGPTAPDDDPDFLAGLNRSAPPSGGTSGSSGTPPRPSGYGPAHNDPAHNDPAHNGPAHEGPSGTPPAHEEDGDDSPDDDQDPRRHGKDRRGRPGTNS